jgi:UDP-N-acetylmuramoyl-tripeptide--D-alanyl-D-alanine ligase
MVDNALAALAAAAACDVPLDRAATALGDAALSRWRMELTSLPSGARLLNDAYNANPASMAAALRALAALDADRRIAVLGVMAEIGETSEAEHRAVGALARELGIAVVAVGVPAYGGTDVADLDGAVAAVGDLGPGDAVLLKGSRVAGLERLVDLLR